MTKLPTDEELVERRRRYGRHLRAQPVRSSQVPAVLQSRPEFRGLAEEREELLRAEGRIRGLAEARRHRMNLANAERAEKVRAAMLDSSLPVPPPIEEEPWPWPVYPQHYFDELHSLLEATEVGMLEDAHDELTAWLEAKAGPVRERIEKLRQQLAEAESNLLPLDSGTEELRRLRERADLRRSGGSSSTASRAPRPSAARLDDSPEARAALREVEDMLIESRRRPTRRHGLR